MRKIFFDLDGTIIDSSEGIFSSIQFAMNHMDLPLLDNATLASFVGPPLLESFLMMGLSEERATQAVTYYRKNYQEEGVYQLTLYDEIRPVLSELAQNNLLYIATSKPEYFAKKIMNHLDLTQVFQGIYGADFENRRSKKADVLAYAIENSDIREHDEQLMIGDRKHDIIGAKQNGIEGIGVTYGFGSAKELLDAGAKAVVDSPQQLLDYLS